MKLFDRDMWEKRITVTGESLTKLITPKRVAFLFTAIYFLRWIALFWIARDNYPSADDYSIGSGCRLVWMERHSLLQTILQGIVHAADDWMNWMGYFTSNYLMAVPPSVFGERWYVLTTWIMLGMLSFATMYLIHSILVKALNADKYISHSIAMVILFATVQCMCPAGRVEACYWYCGAANYIFVHGMSLFYFGLLISAYYDKGKKRIWDLVAASILGFLTGGGNQMTALNVAVVVLIGIVMLTLGKKWSRCRILGIPMGFFYLGFIMNVASPGNWVRASETSGMGPIKAVFVSFYECLDRAVSEWTTWPVIVLMLMLIPLFWHVAGSVRLNYRYPAVILFLGYCLVSAMMTPPFFAVGNIEAGRIQALTYVMYILILSLCVGYMTGWVRRRMDEKAQKNAEDKRFTVSQSWCLVGCFLLLVCGSILNVIPEPHCFTYSSAIEDLRNGSAKAYGEVLRERIEVYHDGSQGVVEVDPLPARPELLYFSDIREDGGYWENIGLARFYALDGVRVKDE